VTGDSRYDSHIHHLSSHLKNEIEFPLLSFTLTHTSQVRDRFAAVVVSSMMTLHSNFLYIMWDFATRIGMRRLGTVLQTTLPRRYQDSIFFVESPATIISNDQNHNDSDNRDQPWVQRQQQQFIALTIDDGVCRPLPCTATTTTTTITTTTTTKDYCMIREVCDLLDMYQHSKATFFICTDYTTFQDASLLLSRGHELGNHLQRDVSNYYCFLSQQDFEVQLAQANQILEQILQQHQQQQRQYQQKRIRWFRAPQGRMSVAMNQILKKNDMTNIMGDVYCDDWALTESVDGVDDDAAQQQQRAATMIANLMIRQAQPGSIAIFHMPQRNFRKASILALERFLQYCGDQNWKCVTVTELVQQLQTPVAIGAATQVDHESTR
jgi:peptidoglycan/xylan/chitin deacetylase (PgdA/CDA1 family)